MAERDLPLHVFHLEGPESVFAGSPYSTYNHVRWSYPGGYAGGHAGGHAGGKVRRQCPCVMDGR
jgi:hypothetical protein